MMQVLTLLLDPFIWSSHPRCFFFVEVLLFCLVAKSTTKNDLRWNSHVENIVVKANKSLGFVRRNLYPCSENTKHSANVTIVKPNLEYTTAVWDPYRQEQIDSIEAVQWHAARFIKRDYNRTSSIAEMLQSLDLHLLEHRHKAHRLNIFYLAVNNSIALPIPNYFLPKQRFTTSFSNDSF